MHRKTLNKWWLQLSGSIVGFDEGGEGEGAGEGAGQGAGGEGQGTGEGAGEGDGEEGKTYTAAELAGIKSALAKERNERKAADKELAAFRKAKAEAADSEKTEIQRLTDSHANLADKYTKLAAGYRSDALERAVLAAAKDAKFRDPSDAMRFDIVSGLEVEQDEDDPTKVTVNTDELVKRIKKLAADKPHYLAEGTPPARRGATKTGSTFNGANNGSKKGDADLAALQAKYPALRGF